MGSDVAGKKKRKMGSDPREIEGRGMKIVNTDGQIKKIDSNHWEVLSQSIKDHDQTSR